MTPLTSDDDPAEVDAVLAVLSDVEEKMIQRFCTKEMRALMPEFRAAAADAEGLMRNMLEQKLAMLERVAGLIEKQQAKEQRSSTMH